METCRSCLWLLRLWGTSKNQWHSSLLILHSKEFQYLLQVLPLARIKFFLPLNRRIPQQQLWDLLLLSHPKRLQCHHFESLRLWLQVPFTACTPSSRLLGRTSSRQCRALWQGHRPEDHTSQVVSTWLSPSLLSDKSQTDVLSTWSVGMKLFFQGIKCVRATVRILGRSSVLCKSIYNKCRMCVLGLQDS